MLQFTLKWLWRQHMNCQAVTWLMPAVLGKGITWQCRVVLWVTLSFWDFSAFSVWKMAGLQPGGVGRDSCPWASHRKGVSAALQTLYMRCLNLVHECMLRAIHLRRAAPLSPPVATIFSKKRREGQPSMPRTSTQRFKSRGRMGQWSYLASAPKCWERWDFKHVLLFLVISQIFHPPPSILAVLNLNSPWKMKCRDRRYLFWEEGGIACQDPGA